MEVLDHKARERAGIITPTLGSPISVLLHPDVAIEVKICFDRGVLTNINASCHSLLLCPSNSYLILCF